MLVADFNQAASSATLGAGQAKKMSFSEDPAMFVAMIANLYSNQKLAFIRETLCNAWDAHIASGKTNLPITITVDEGYLLTIRDYGYGIPVDNMEATYNTLGGTTKRNSIGETGGFGLGCKSPLAYVDSFVVTTMNQGTKAIYNMVKSAVELDGCPGLIPITSMPTQESGLEVRIQLKEEDFREIHGYITSVLFNGEIIARYSHPKFGSSPVEMAEYIPNTLGMSFDVGSYDTDGEWYRNYMGRGRIFIRYANVIYPALETPATEEALTLLRKFMSIVGCDHFLVQAAPNTLALSPSRETLSSQQMTEDGITQLALAAVEKLENDIKSGIPDALDALEHGVKTRFKNVIHNNIALGDFSQFIPDGIVKRYMLSALWKAQRAHWYAYLNNLAIDTDLMAMGLNLDLFNVNLIRKECKLHNRVWSAAPNSKHMGKVINRHISKTLVKLGVKPAAISMVVNSSYYPPIGTVSTIDENHSVKNSAMALLVKDCKLVFITTRKAYLDDSLKGCPELKDGNHNTKAGFIIRVSTKKGEADEMSNLLKGAGYNVINLADNHDWDAVAQRRIASAKIAASKRATEAKLSPDAKQKEYKPNQLVSINCMINERGVYWRAGASDSHWQSQTVVDKPTHYIYLDDIEHWGGSIKYGNVLAIPESIRATTVVCRNRIEVNKAIKRGAVNLEIAMAKQVIDVFQSKGFHKYLESENSSAWEQYELDDNHKTLFGLIGFKVTALSKMKENVIYNTVLDAISNMRGNSYRTRELFTKAGIDPTKDAVYSKVEQAMLTFRPYSTYKHFAELTRISEVVNNYDSLCLLAHMSAEEMVAIVKADPAIAPIIKRIFTHYTTENISE